MQSISPRPGSLSLELTPQHSQPRTEALSIDIDQGPDRESYGGPCPSLCNLSATIRACRNLLANTVLFSGVVVMLGGLAGTLPTLGVLCALGLNHKGPFALPENCGFSPPPPAAANATDVGDDYLSGRYGLVNLEDHPCGADYALRQTNMRAGAIVCLGISGAIAAGLLYSSAKDAIKYIRKSISES